MAKDSFFCNLSSDRIEKIIERSNEYVCYVAPGIRSGPAAALKNATERLGKDMVVVWIDFDEHVMRMGYGELEAVKTLQDAGITVNHAPALRSSLILADGKGYAFTQTPLYLEAEPDNNVRNAIELSRDQVSEALERFLPAPKVKAIALIDNQTENKIDCYLSLEKESTPITETLFNEVEKSLSEAPPAKFDIARQVRVFQPYLQYVELKREGAAIQRRRITIPPSIQKLGIGKDIEGRLRTTFDLLEKDSELSSKELVDKLNEIRSDFTRSLGNNYGRVFLKINKPILSERLNKFREMLDKHEKKVKAGLQKKLDKSQTQILKYYLPIVIKNPPDVLIGQLTNKNDLKEMAKIWLKSELDKVFPKAETLTEKMTLVEQYKDVCFETLNDAEFVNKIKILFPNANWDKPLKEFLAAKEKSNKTKD